MINRLAREIFENAKAHGFYEEITKMDSPVWISNRLMLIVSELSEGLEGVRSNNFSSAPKSGGLGEELADACIRIFDLAWSLGIDLEEAILQKHEFNKTRPYKHGRSSL